MIKEANYIIRIEYREYENVYPQEFVTQMINSGICSVKNNKVAFKATGIVIYKNIFIIIFPKNYNVPHDDRNLKEHVQILFQVLLKYRTDNDLSLEEIDLLGGEKGQYKENLFTAYRLILDYIQNGPLKKEWRIESSSHSGKIDWVATVNKKQPIFSGKSVIYSEAISRKNTMDRQHLLLKIHRYCICRIIQNYGWLFEVSLENLNIEEEELPCDINYAVNFLTNELNRTFIEREVKVISILINFLSGINLEEYEEKIDTLVTPYFHNVWETICSHIFNNQYKILKPIIPKLKWEVNSKAKVQSQRPDIIILRKERMYILDAKYYNVEINLPGWPDVVKQLFYAYTILKNMKSKNLKVTNEIIKNRIQEVEKVENAFLFPSGDVEPIKYIGKVTIEENNELGDVKSFKINTFLAMNCYIGKEEYDFIKHI